MLTFMTTGIITIENVMTFIEHNLLEQKLHQYEAVVFCSKTIDTPFHKCESIVIGPRDYYLNETRMHLINHTDEVSTIHSGNFLVLSDKSARICINTSRSEVSVDRAPSRSRFISNPLDGVSFGLTLLSLIGEVGTIITYSRFKQLRNTYGCGIICLSFALVFAQVCSLASTMILLSDRACVVIAAVSHYFWLSVFSWTTVLAIILVDTFAIRPLQATGGSTKKSLLMYLISGWCTPLVIVSVVLSVHFCDCIASGGIYGGKVACWIIDPQINLYVFGIPVALSISINTVLLLVTFISLVKKRRKSNRLQNKTPSSDGLKEAILFSKVGMKNVFVAIF